MKTCYKCKENKTLDNFYKNKSQFDGFKYECKTCTKKEVTLYFNQNKDKKSQYAKNTYLNNREYYLSQSSEWAKNNPDKANARTTKYTTRKQKACPLWLTNNQLSEIVLFYKLAKEKTIKTGIKHEVDHIIPLKGKLVSGLHVPWNLQVITKIENCKKLNSYGNNR